VDISLPWSECFPQVQHVHVPREDKYLRLHKMVPVRPQNNSGSWMI